jgi:hypothetical protein
MAPAGQHTGLSEPKVSVSLDGRSRCSGRAGLPVSREGRNGCGAEVARFPLSAFQISAFSFCSLAVQKSVFIRVHPWLNCFLLSQFQIFNAALDSRLRWPSVSGAIKPRIGAARAFGRFMRRKWLFA